MAIYWRVSRRGNLTKPISPGELASTCDSVWPDVTCTCDDLLWLDLMKVDASFHRLATQTKSTQVEAHVQFKTVTSFVINNKTKKTNDPTWDNRTWDKRTTQCRVVCITARTNHKFISFSAVKIYDLSYIHLHSFTFYGYIRNSQFDQLPRTYHCTGIAEVMVRIPFRPKFFSGFNFTTD